jgi:hypothetical protein
MRRGDCSLCSKPLHDEPGPVVMDRAGVSYHLACWCRLMDIRIQETRDLIAKNRAKLARSETPAPPPADDPV